MCTAALTYERVKLVPLYEHPVSTHGSGAQPAIADARQTGLDFLQGQTVLLLRSLQGFTVGLTVRHFWFDCIFCGFGLDSDHLFVFGFALDVFHRDGGRIGRTRRRRILYETIQGWSVLYLLIGFNCIFMGRV